MKRWCGWLVLALAGAIFWWRSASGTEWRRWRGPDGSAVCDEAPLPQRWSRTENVVWCVSVEGEGASSPIVHGDRVWLTSAQQFGERRTLWCFDRRTGQRLWSVDVEDENPEVTSALTGHAAATPSTDGRRIVAFFGNAGVVCCDRDGQLLWRRRLGPFESELGLASSPIIEGDRVIVLCDHDGKPPRSFHSFLIALNIADGSLRWKTERPKLFRSWSTPIVARTRERQELIVAAQDAVRAYDLQTGTELWSISGLTGWVAPSPVAADGRLFVTSGRDGPIMAISLNERNADGRPRVLWSADGGPYVCSPLVYQGLLYVHNEQGILKCFDAATGRLVYRHRLPGRFYASGVAGDGKLYLTSDSGTTYVIRAGPQFQLLAENRLDEECLASPAIAGGHLFIRTQSRLYCIGPDKPPH